MFKKKLEKALIIVLKGTVDSNENGEGLGRWQMLGTVVSRTAAF
jgi:hypothetical protein